MSADRHTVHTSWTTGQTAPGRSVFWWAGVIRCSTACPATTVGTVASPVCRTPLCRTTVWVNCWVCRGSTRRAPRRLRLLTRRPPPVACAPESVAAASTRRWASSEETMQQAALNQFLSCLGDGPGAGRLPSAVAAASRRSARCRLSIWKKCPGRGATPRTHQARAREPPSTRAGAPHVPR